ncbi:MAG: class I SAM-dependent methyltransferase [Gemmatimonadaceae bacterium]
MYDMALTNISDTARWVATYRARESERPDAIFHDPFARRLAGDQGETIVASVKDGERMSWAMVVRTAVFDEMLMASIARDKIDLVLNLAAGLDARPWRLTLPPSLRWIDVDLPDILAYKTETMKGEVPRCHYESVSADLTDLDRRAALLARLANGARSVFVLTEGLLIYLTESQVETLARDIRAIPGIRGWVIDLITPRLLKYMTRSAGESTAKANAPFLFAPVEGTAFFARMGWCDGEYRESADEGKRLKREMQIPAIWKAVGWIFSRLRPQRMAGIVRLDPA